MTNCDLRPTLQHQKWYSRKIGNKLRNRFTVFEIPRVFVRLDHIALMDLTRFCIFRVTFEPDFYALPSVSGTTRKEHPK